MEKEDKVLINKIEVDEKTKEPKIVTVSCNEIPMVEQKEEQQEDVIDERQIVMKTIFGYDKKEEQSMDKRRKLFKNICTILFIVFVVGVLIYTILDDFVFNKSTEVVRPSLRNVFEENWYYIFGALGVLAIAFVLKAVKIALMCKTTMGKACWKVSFQTSVVGLFYNYVTPLAVGGQPFEVYHLSKHGIKGGCATSIPITTYVFNQMAYIILAIFSLISYKTNLLSIPEQMDYLPTSIWILAIVGISFTMIIPVLVVVFSIIPRLCAKLIYFVMWLGYKIKIVKDPKAMVFKTMKSIIVNAKIIKYMFKKPLIFFANLMLSFGEHLFLSSIAYFVLKFYGFDWPAWSIWEWAQIVQICILISSAVAIFPTPGNSGAADLSFYAIFSGELAKGLAVPAMMTWRFMSFYLIIIFGFIVIRIIKKKDKRIELAGKLNN